MNCLKEYKKVLKEQLRLVKEERKISDDNLNKCKGTEDALLDSKEYWENHARQSECDKKENELLQQCYREGYKVEADAAFNEFLDSI